MLAFPAEITEICVTGRGVLSSFVAKAMERAAAVLPPGAVYELHRSKPLDDDGACAVAYSWHKDMARKPLFLCDGKEEDVGPYWVLGRVRAGEPHV